MTHLAHNLVGSLCYTLPHIAGHIPSLALQVRKSQVCYFFDVMRFLTKVQGILNRSPQQRASMANYYTIFNGCILKSLIQLNMIFFPPYSCMAGSKTFLISI